MHNQDSIKKRYFYKLIVRIVSLFLYAAKVSLVPRALGPAKYGDFSFLSGVFTSIINFFDFGSSNAFFNYNSKNKESGAAVIFYVLYSLLVPVVLIAIIVLSGFFGWAGHLWPDQPIKYVYIAAILAWLLWLSNIIFGYSDARGLTVVSELVRLKVRVFFTLVLVAMFLFKYLNLLTFFIFSILETIGFIVYTVICCRKDQDRAGLSYKNLKTKFKSLLKYFYQYCSPLFLYSVIVLITGFWGRWFLQLVNGSVEQGFYGLSDKISSISLIFTVSMIPIFMNEFSKAHGLSDFDAMRRLFRENAKLFYFLAGFLAVFFVAYTPEITFIFAGEEFKNAIWPIAIMAFYPLPQTYAQMNGTVFYSTERTLSYRNIGISLIAMGVIFNYFFVAPKTFFIPGLGLGAMGAALSGVLVATIGTNWQLFANCRYLRLRYREFLWHQISSLLVLAAAALITKAVLYLIPLDLGLWVILPAGLIYTAFGALLTWRFSMATVGFESQRIKEYFKIFINKVRAVYKPSAVNIPPTSNNNLT